MKRSTICSSIPILLLLLWAVPVAGQQQQDPPPPEGAQATETEPSQEGLDELTGEESEFTSNIEQILQEDEAVMTGSGYTYDSAGRRDPFKSLVQNRRNAVTRQGPRPEGKAGLLIDEISLTGVFQTPEGAFAQVQGGPKNKSYLLQAGDQLYDGDVVEVGREEIVFKQLINDPTAIKPFREVVKRLSTD
jgi:Tfp pilus assembly protein PilP